MWCTQVSSVVIIYSRKYLLAVLKTEKNCLYAGTCLPGNFFGTQSWVFTCKNYISHLFIYCFIVAAIFVVTSHACTQYGGCSCYYKKYCMPFCCFVFLQLLQCFNYNWFMSTFASWTFILICLLIWCFLSLSCMYLKYMFVTICSVKLLQILFFKSYKGYTCFTFYYT